MSCDSHSVETPKSHLLPGGSILKHLHICSGLVSDATPPPRLAVPQAPEWSLVEPGGMLFSLRDTMWCLSFSTWSPASRLRAESQLAPRRVLSNQELNTYSTLK